MSDNEPVRQRTFTWEDPLVGVRQAAHLSGLAYIQAIQQGKIAEPPIARLMGMEITEVAEGRVKFSLSPGEYHYNPVGVVHGGVAATLCDSAMACAVQTLLPAGMIYTTLELHVNYVRPMTMATGVVHCLGEVIHQGKRVATAQARLLDEQGRLYAHGTTTCLIFPVTQGGESRE
ncbi:MAG: PaaI family thioesterase [Anaerolineae bacterium]|nr:PaaI family thioesterase [Anaerolineae bacterium]